MKKFLLAALLLLVSAPSQAQENRAGICYLNTGQLVQEDDNVVRSGNMGNENACVYASFGDGLYIGGMVAFTKMFIFPKPEGGVSRWSWRPTAGSRETDFIWLHPEVGYNLPVGRFLEFRPNVALWWPAATSYMWGAPVGPLYGGGLETVFKAQLTKSLGIDLSLRLDYAHKSRQSWTVLHDWSDNEWPNGETEQTESHVWPVSIGLGVRF